MLLEENCLNTLFSINELKKRNLVSSFNKSSVVSIIFTNWTLYIEISNQRTFYSIITKPSRLLTLDFQTHTRMVNYSKLHADLLAMQLQRWSLARSIMDRMLTFGQQESSCLLLCVGIFLLKIPILLSFIRKFWVGISSFRSLWVMIVKI